MRDAIAMIKGSGLGRGGMIKYVDSDSLRYGHVPVHTTPRPRSSAGTVNNLQASRRGPEEAQEPLIRTLSPARWEQGEKLTLQGARGFDDGELTHAWYVSDSGTHEPCLCSGQHPRGRHRQGRRVVLFRKIVNTLGESHITANTQMIRVEGMTKRQ